MYSAERYHDFSAGHRVVGHEGKCRFVHGHNYRVHFVCEPEGVDGGLDHLGRVIDFGVIKELLCEWLELHWDHKTLIWEQDHMLQELRNVMFDSIVQVPFNPTAEMMAVHLVKVVGPQVLMGTGIVLRTVRVEETRKCSATYTRERQTYDRFGPRVS